jgi:excinuclease ABC subunit A
MTENQIIITEINHHNFKNVSLSIPKNKLIIFTGPSGSGKSTLVIDIIYAESQRKFIESLPLYARQFIGLPEKAQIKKITGLTPAIAIDQKKSSSNSR